MQNNGHDHGRTMAAIPAALTFDRITNGLTRPFFGWVSDHIGRENTMGIAFILEGIAIWLMLQYRSDPFMLIVLSGLVFFGWGEIFSLFPSTLTDTFGPKNATTNYGFLYMAQGVGSILGAPVAAMIFERDRELDAGVLHDHYPRHSDRVARGTRAEGDAAAVPGGRALASHTKTGERGRGCRGPFFIQNPRPGRRCVDRQRPR